jgi:hypothetical protein
MNNIVFSTLAVAGKPELDTMLLVESLRKFAGQLGSNPVWVLAPTQLGPLLDSTQRKLAQLDVRVIPFEIDLEILRFPFAVKVLAAAALEAQAMEESECLVYMDRDTIVLREPYEFVISPGKALGYRPVHHKLIGSSWDSALDSFWSLIYEICNVPEENLFPMMTHVGEMIRPYFNAGVYVIRPEKGLLTQWQDIFLSWYRNPQLKRFYDQDPIYKIFIHQAIFSGVLLQNLKPEQMSVLKSNINYPLHLHGDIPLDQRPTTIDQLVTVRYENIFDEFDWQQLPFSESLKDWLLMQPRIRTTLDENP